VRLDVAVTAVWIGWIKVETGSTKFVVDQAQRLRLWSSVGMKFWDGRGVSYSKYEMEIPRVVVQTWLTHVVVKSCNASSKVIELVVMLERDVPA
jgi:hypothetical protein